MLEFRDVGFIVLRDVGNRGPRLPQMFGSLAAYSADRNALDLSPLGKIWQLRLSELSSSRSLRSRRYRSEQRFRMRLDVVLADAAAGAGSFHTVNVDADLAC